MSLTTRNLHLNSPFSFIIISEGQLKLIKQKTFLTGVTCYWSQQIFKRVDFWFYLQLYCGKSIETKSESIKSTEILKQF